LRLDAEDPEQDSRDGRTTIELNKAADEQRRRPESVLSAPDIDRHRRRQRQEHEVVDAAFTVRHHDEIHEHSGHTIQDIGRHVGHEREGPGKKQKMRGV